ARGSAGVGGCGTDVIAIVGPTASGKSALAMRVAERIGGEIVSADSRQVYRGMDIGTAKPTADERARVPHHLIDIADPGERYDVLRFQRDGRAALAAIRGGSGLASSRRPAWGAAYRAPAAARSARRGDRAARARHGRGGRAGRSARADRPRGRPVAARDERAWLRPLGGAPAR